MKQLLFTSILFGLIVNLSAMDAILKDRVGSKGKTEKKYHCFNCAFFVQTHNMMFPPYAQKPTDEQIIKKYEGLINGIHAVVYGKSRLDAAINMNDLRAAELFLQKGDKPATKYLQSYCTSPEIIALILEK